MDKHLHWRYLYHPVQVSHPPLAPSIKPFHRSFQTMLTSPVPRHVQHTLEAAYCTDLGQVKTGADAANTYLLMLQQIHKLTEPVAAAIVAEYPSLPSLIAGFRSAGPEMLQDLHPLMRKDGAATDRRIGPQMSRRVYAVFFGLDPKSTDV